MRDSRSLEFGFWCRWSRGVPSLPAVPRADSQLVLSAEAGAHVHIVLAARPDRSANYRIGRLLVAVEGDVGVHRALTELQQARRSAAPITPAQLVSLACEEGQAALCIYDEVNGQCLIVPGHLAGMPVFYQFSPHHCDATTMPGGLARVGSTADLAGVVGFLRDAHLTGSRTLTRDVRQLIAGQRLIINANGARVERAERMWWSHPGRRDQSDTGTAEDALWHAMTKTVAHCVGEADRVGVMMSGGWDSRTVLGAVVDTVPAARAIALCHGDLESAELRIASALCTRVGAHFVGREIEPEDYEHLSQLYQDSGTSIFPYWRTAAQRLVTEGAAVSTSGVYGEILGGRLSPKFFLRNGVTRTDEIRSLFALFPSRLLEGPLHRPNFTLGNVSLPWVLRADLESQMPDVRDALNADLAELLDHIESLDTDGLNAVEVFVSLTRRGGYTNGQARTLRAILPTFDIVSSARSLKAINAIPFSARHNNALNRRLLLKHQPALLRERVAASLVPANFPISLQQGARLVRKVVGDASVTVVKRLGRTPPAQFRTGWVNFGFLHRSAVLPGIVDSLHSDIWDREAMRSVIARHNAQAVPGNLHSLADMLLKVLDIDQWLRG